MDFTRHHPRDIIRLIIILFIISICFIVTLYFSLVLKVTTVYTHIFYLPVMLASLWWRKRGIPVVLTLSLLLLISYGLSSKSMITTSDYARVAVFLSVGLLIMHIPDRSSALNFESFPASLEKIQNWLRNETVRISIIGILVAFCCLITVYFHIRLNRGTVFSHFFYVPIILSAIWWRSRGLWVAFFLAGFLLYGHLFLRNYVTTINDYFRAGMFIIVPMIISLLGERITSAEKKIEYLHFATNLINNITRLIVDELDREKLAEGFATAISESYGCDLVIISLSGKSGGFKKKLVKATDYGDEMIKTWTDRTLHCHDNIMPLDSPRITVCNRCINVPFCMKYNRFSVTYPIKHDRESYGTLTTLFTEEIRDRGALSTLIATVSDELGYALYNLDVALKKKKAEEQLYYDELRAKTILELGSMTNAGLEKICIYALEEAIKITRSRAGYFAILNEDGTTSDIISSYPEMMLRESYTANPAETLSLLHADSLKQARITDDPQRIEQVVRIYRIDGLKFVNHLEVPVKSSGETVAVIGVGKDESSYHGTDIMNLTLLTQGIWTMFRQRKAEIELEKYRDHLQEMVELKTSELTETNRKLTEEIHERQTLYRELQNSSQELESFVNTVTHDLRSPLSIIGLCAQIIEKVYTGSFDDKGIKLLDQIGRNALRMEELIKDLLALSRVRHDSNTGEEIDTSSLVREITERLNQLLRQNRIHISVPAPLPRVWGNRTQIVQVFENLITNAVKYMGEREKPEIIIEAADQEGGLCTFFVRDNGIGISKDKIDKIFREFYRAHDIKTDGTGIGLAIVKKIVEKHGGSVGVESEPGNGSTFKFTLPSASR